MVPNYEAVVVSGERKCSRVVLLAGRGGKTPWCPALWVEPGSAQVAIVGAAELGARGRRCPGLMCRGVVFVKTGPLMTLFPFSSSRPLPPTALVNLEAICLLSTEKVQAWSPPASAECLLPTALNPLDKLKQGNYRATDHIGPLRAGASAVSIMQTWTLLRCTHLILLRKGA